jgi:hypothetical protein
MAVWISLCVICEEWAYEDIETETHGRQYFCPKHLKEIERLLEEKEAAKMHKELSTKTVGPTCERSLDIQTSGRSVITTIAVDHRRGKRCE